MKTNIIDFLISMFEGELDDYKRETVTKKEAVDSLKRAIDFVFYHGSDLTPYIDKLIRASEIEDNDE